MSSTRSVLPILAFLLIGVVNLVSGIAYLIDEHVAAGATLVLIGSLLCIAATMGLREHGRAGTSEIRFTPYAYSYALIGIVFLVAATALFVGGVSTLKDGNGGRAWLALVAAFLFLLLGIGAAASMLVAPRIARGVAGHKTRWWLPGWRMFIEDGDTETDRDVD